MPSIETATLHEWALVWLRTGTLRSGDPNIATEPVEIKARWLKDRRDIKDTNNATVSVEDLIMLASPVTIGSRIWKGTLAQWEGTGTGTPGAGQVVFEVLTTNETPDVKARNRAYEAWVVKQRTV